ncbi:hypothetical protein ABPG72_001651 [Tetrahymena utriculariae]
MNKSILVLAILICTAMAAGIKTPDTRKYKFIFFTEECFDTFFVQKDFANVSCIKFTLSKALGTGIVVFSTILKVPQIIKIVKNKSVEGLSFPALISETFLYFFTVSYNLFKQNSFSLYGENVFIIFQNIVIMALFYVYGKNFSIAKLFTTYILFGVVVGPLLLQIAPTKLYDFAMIINIVLFFFGRAPQIYSNFKNKSTGQLAAITVLLNLSGCVARTFTVLTEAPDFFVLLNNFEAVILNGTIFAQLLIYWKNTPARAHHSAKKNQ